MNRKKISSQKMDKVSLVNVGTYKEIEYLKKTLGPVLVSALAELCVKRPTDPIEYLGHWLLRWRYNEELKKRDMENALEVIRQRQAAKCERELNITECKLPLDPYGQGVIPDYPYMPPGYGGPIDPADLVEPEEEGEVEEEEEEYEMPGEDYVPPPPYFTEFAGEDNPNYNAYPYDNNGQYWNNDGQAPLDQATGYPQPQNNQWTEQQQQQQAYPQQNYQQQQPQAPPPLHQ